MGKNSARDREFHECGLMDDLVEESGDHRVRKAVLFMEEHISRPLTIEPIAEHTGLSSRQLERLFQIFLDDSPSEYFRKLRLKHARWLLLNTTKTICDIALECGFTDGSHLTKRYKEYYGHAPSLERLKKP